MKVLGEVDVADSCLVSEAVCWLAIGRLPIAEYQSNMEIRDDIANFEPNGFTGIDYGFSVEEFEAIGAEVDYNEYEQVCYFEEMPKSAPDHLKVSTADLLKNIEETPDPFDASKEFTKIMDAMGAVRQKYLDDIESPFNWYLNSALVAVMGKLLSGELEATGVRERKSDSDYPEYEFAEISKSQWSPRHFDLGTSTLETSDRVFWMTKLDTSKVISVFPNPMVSEVSITVRQIGRHFLTGTSGDLVSDRRKLGRPRKTAHGVELIVQREFDQRRASGRLPDKREAVLEEAMNWCEEILGASMSRSSAQRYLAPVFEKMPKKV